MYQIKKGSSFLVQDAGMLALIGLAVVYIVYWHMCTSNFSNYTLTRFIILHNQHNNKAQLKVKWMTQGWDAGGDMKLRDLYILYISYIVYIWYPSWCEGYKWYWQLASHLIRTLLLPHAGDKLLYKTQSLQQNSRHQRRFSEVSMS